MFTLIPNLLFSYANNPPNGRTGAPGEGTCGDCHSSYTLNSGSGSVYLTGVPNEYNPGETYAITVHVSHPSMTRWGFELAAKNDDGMQGGEILVTQSSLTTSSNWNDITYIKQRNQGTFAGQNNGADWTFDWQAPQQDDGVISFYVAGNTANFSNNTAGDYIYTNSSYSEPAPSCTATGDVTEDGLINIVDVITVVNHVLEISELIGVGYCNGDINADGTIDVSDIVGIVDIILGND